MTSLIGILVLVGVLRLLVATERPLLCAAIYTAAVAILSLLNGDDLISLLGTTALALAFTAGWFWLLTRFEAGTAPWFLALVAGLTLPMVVGAIWRFAI